MDLVKLVDDKTNTFFITQKDYTQECYYIFIINTLNSLLGILLVLWTSVWSIW
jgi:hypothetical protein